MSERETGAQSEQVTCHKRNDDEVRGPHWECKLPGVKGGWVLDPPFCPTCGTGLRADGTEQARCDVVTSEAVKGTRLYRELASQSTLSEEDTIILAALQQARGHLTMTQQDLSQYDDGTGDADLREGLRRCREVNGQALASLASGEPTATEAATGGKE